MRTDTKTRPSSSRERAWETGFAMLTRYKAREGHCQVPRNHREGAFNLGIWVINQRNRRDALSTERKRRLEAIGFVWRIRAGDPWEGGIAALKQFRAREGHCNVPSAHEEGSFKLGGWVGRQRRKKSAMPLARRRQLDAVGFVWKPVRSGWESGFAALRRFKAREKHCRVPRGHREGDINLGTWVVNQRNRRDTLTAQRRRQLEAIGFVWRIRPPSSLAGRST